MRRFLIFSLAVLLAGCATAGSLQRTLEDKKGALLYVHDSEKVTEKKSGSLALGTYAVADVLAPETTVTKKSSYFLPLIFFNMWKEEDQARLGYAQMENDYKQFFRESLVDELKRSSSYDLQDGPGTVSLDVKVTKLEMSAPINQGGDFIFAFFFFAFGNGRTAGPVDVSIAADVQARKGGAVVLSKEVDGHFRTNILPGKKANLEDYTTSMIEGVSMAIKDLNEKIVKEINNI